MHRAFYIALIQNVKDSLKELQEDIKVAKDHGIRFNLGLYTGTDLEELKVTNVHKKLESGAWISGYEEELK